MEFSAAFRTALALILDLDPTLLEIVRLSLSVSLSAVAIAALIGLPLGAAVALGRFPGRGAVIVLLNASMGLPPVVVDPLVPTWLAGGAVVLLLVAAAAEVAAHRRDRLSEVVRVGETPS